MTTAIKNVSWDTKLDSTGLISKTTEIIVLLGPKCMLNRASIILLAFAS
jgi:hypothetical protein